MTELIGPVGNMYLAVFAGMVGTVFGSYIGVLIARWPHGEATIHGRSRCDDCRRPLAWFEMIPLLSWAILGRKCRRCKAPIDPYQPMCEALAGAFAFCAFLILPKEAALAWTALCLLLLPLALLDLKYYWLPTRLIVLLGLTGIIIGGVTAPESGMASRLIGGVIVFSLLEGVRRIYLFLRQREGMGAGDPKLAGAIALWFSPWDLPLLLLASSIIGILLAIGLGGLRDLNKRLPFGTCLAAAAILSPIAKSLPAITG